MTRRNEAPNSAESMTQTQKLESMEPRTLDQMLKYRVQLTPDSPLLWYPSTDTDYQSYSAAELDTRVQHAASIYSKRIPKRTSSNEKPRLVGLLGLPDLDYVIAMFAMYRLGHTVVALSPRLAKEGYEHLLRLLDVHDVVYHRSQTKMAHLLEDSQNLQLHDLLAQDGQENSNVEDGEVEPDITELDMDIEGKNIAIVIHSSGSTGLPKPTKLAHKDLVTGANKNFNMEAFSCVPFFHGFGLTGLHRGIYSGKQFFFYNASLPLTSKHLINTIMNNRFEIFFCVPYALKLLAETDAGIAALQKCKLVWFAGSACPDDLGDLLTAKGIRLVSDYGLSECGPLMTTMRPQNDDAWNYLRPLPHNKPFMVFEEREAGTFELVCHEGMAWTMAINRDDRSYATGDLFEKHPTIKDAYKFVSRLDDTLVLSNGEKANPLNPEGGARQHALVAEAVMFGVGRNELGMMLIRSDAARDMSEDEILDQVWPTIESAQSEMPQHGKIVRTMVKTLPSDTNWPKTDKGTVIRKKFYQMFSKEIEGAYDEEVSSTQLKLDETGLQDLIRDELRHALRMEDTEDLSLDTDLFSIGVDSLQSTQLRRTLQARVDLNGQQLPFNVVYENPSIRQLSNFVHSMSTGIEHRDENHNETFAALIEEHGNFSMQKPDDQSHCVILTGATGSLGAHMLTQLVQDKSVKRVYCLVRAASSRAALVRVNESLLSRKTYLELSKMEKSKIVALTSDLASSNLGLDPAIYRKMSLEATAVIHAAWPVNFNMSLRSFQSDIAGTKNLLDCCLTPGRAQPASFSFCSSISTSMNLPLDATVPETVPSDPSPALEMGYAQSKLVAENLCIRAAKQTGMKAYILRIGQVVGDTNYGVWNATEAVPMMMQTAQTIGALPDIEEIHRWLPVDIVAKTILETSLPAEAVPGTVFNIINPTGFKWKSDLLPKLRKANLNFEEVPIAMWLERLRDSDQNGNANPPIKLLSYFESVYGDGEPEGRGEAHEWETQNAVKYSPTFAEGWELSENMVQRFIGYFREIGWKSLLEITRDRQASWSSENTLNEFEEVERKEMDREDGQHGEIMAEKIDLRERMYNDLEWKSDEDSPTPSREETERKGQIFWDDDQKRLDIRGVSDHETHADGRISRKANIQPLEVDIDALKAGKVLVWSDTHFELRHPESLTLGSKPHVSGKVSDAVSDNKQLPNDDGVLVPRAGEIVWDSDSSQFALAAYQESKSDDHPSVNTDHVSRTDLDAIRQPKMLVWDGTGFTYQ